jgi:hypothetical protein
LSITRKHDEDLGKEILQAVEGLGASEKAIQEQFGELIGEPDNRQQELLADLLRLHQSLRGPEQLLDRGSYSRPFPPVQNQLNKAVKKGS